MGRDVPDFVASWDRSNILSCLIWITTAQDGQGDHSRGDAKSVFETAVSPCLLDCPIVSLHTQDTAYTGLCSENCSAISLVWIHRGVWL